MLSNITLGRFYQGNSIIHKLSSVFKIISLVIMVVSIFFIDSYIDVLVLGSYLLLSIFSSGVPIGVYLKNISGIKIFLVFIFVIDLIFYNGINRIVFDLFKLVFIILYSSILTYTTGITEITYGIEEILRPLSKFIPVSDIAMIIALTIRYIPTLTYEANRIIRAQKMRGISFDSSNIKEKIISISGILMPMFVMSIRRANTMADIMDIRLYNYGKSKTNLRSNEWMNRDTSLLILNILILFVVILF